VVIAVRREGAVSDGEALLRCRIAQDRDAIVVHVAGEIDLATRDDFADEVMGALGGSPPLLVLDMHEVTFMGSAGLSVLIQAHEEAQRARCGLRVVVGTGAVSRAIEISGLEQLLAVHKTVDDALAG
jgi:anti-anti-sigma factor